MPSRETWFCLYQPIRGQTAYLYEYDEPINAENYVSKVGPELRRVFRRPAKDCFIATIGGESFTSADAAAPPWFCYRLLLRGGRVGRRLGPYAADDVVSPNSVALPLQQRWRNNVRDVRDILLFLADPTHDRLQAALSSLVAAAHEDRWRGGAALVHECLLRRWGGDALRRHGFTLAAVAAAYRLHGERLKQLEAAEAGVTALTGMAGPVGVGISGAGTREEREQERDAAESGGGRVSDGAGGEGRMQQRQAAASHGGTQTVGAAAGGGVGGQDAPG
ncbi:hypothetical protein HYH02_004689 [Chlamydomonas schloesseri]|uniref:Uncharacterized protein n=1 Tax=Chlamydomonas schloesseri TaxID=2026947 RepID=A0A835WQK4_9CHLO|nr:hypothetical protein HYH02_004689 [Chlamydomonas schloesseri]|eukprot:KAG2450855.1 hypothetical protein HYH02_004689 [Chlamydomonas schloesseri]